MSGGKQRPRAKPELADKVPFWRGVAKQKRARRLTDKAGFKKGWV